MGLSQTQALLARLFTDAELRRAFFDDPLATARGFGLSAGEAESLATIDRREVEDFARSLLGKRALDARKALPLTARALGRDFDALLFEAIERFPPKWEPVRREKARQHIERFPPKWEPVRREKARQHIERFPPKWEPVRRHRADAAALVALLAARAAEPPWIGDLARYEMAFVSAARPGAFFLMRRFAYPVEEIARRLLAGAPIDAAPRRRVGLWWRAPGGRLAWRLFWRGAG